MQNFDAKHTPPPSHFPMLYATEIICLMLKGYIVATSVLILHDSPVDNNRRK